MCACKLQVIKLHTYIKFAEKSKKKLYSKFTCSNEHGETDNGNKILFCMKILQFSSHCFSFVFKKKQRKKQSENLDLFCYQSILKKHKASGCLMQNTISLHR